jgi:hypothetical protein
MASAAERFVADAEVLTDPLVKCQWPISTESLILIDCHWLCGRGVRKTTSLQ